MSARNSDIAGFSPESLKSQLCDFGIDMSCDRVAVAVSGGADSLALTIMIAEIMPIVALTVDHKLRAESGKEAEYVHSILSARGIEHHILNWESSKPASNLQAEARQARYALMEQWCVDRAVFFLLTAHHMNDQAETFLLRLARGSGVYGLASIDKVSRGLFHKNLTVVRPLLNVKKEALEAYLEGLNVEWIKDPSNINENFDRVKVRKFLSDPVLEGFNVDRLATTANHFARTRQALTFYEAAWISDHVQYDEYGAVSFQSEALQKAPEEITLRALAGLIRYVSGQHYPPRFEKLIRLHKLLISDEEFSGQTLMGAIITLSDGIISLCRELGQIEEEITVRAGGSTIWDNRFNVELLLNEVSEGPFENVYNIKALGDDGWSELLSKCPEIRDEKRHRSLPHRVKMSLPAVFDASGLRAVPHLGYNNLQNIKINVSLISGALSKK
jgi:tRNA(Ile)-lysidine synthase